MSWTRRLADLLTLGTTQEVAMTQTLLGLTAQDRCDRCGARASRVTFHESGELMWCTHHWNKYKRALESSLSM